MPPPRSSRSSAMLGDTSGHEMEDEIVSENEGLEFVDSSMGGRKRRKKTAGAGASANGSTRSKRRKRCVGVEDGVSGDTDSIDPTNSLTDSILASTRRDEGTDSTTPMSRIARAAHSTQLSYFDQLATPARSKNTLKDVGKITNEVRQTLNRQ